MIYQHGRSNAPCIPYTLTKHLSKQTTRSPSRRNTIVIIKSQPLHNILFTRPSPIRSIARPIKHSLDPPPHFLILQRRHITTLVFFAVGGTIKLLRTHLDIRIVEEHAALTLNLLHHRAATVVVQLMRSGERRALLIAAVAGWRAGEPAAEAFAE